MLLLMVLARGQRQHRGRCEGGHLLPAQLWASGDRHHHSRTGCHPVTSLARRGPGGGCSAQPWPGALRRRGPGGTAASQHVPPTATPGAGRAGAAAGQGLVLRLQLCRRRWCPGLPTRPGAAGSHGGAAGPRGACPSGSGSPRCPQLPLPSLNVTLGACQLEKRFAGDKRSGCQRRRAARS